MITNEQIKKIENACGGILIEEVENVEKHLYTFECKEGIMFIEKMKKRSSDDAKYYVCFPTNPYDCWDGYDDPREIYKSLNNINEGKPKFAK